MSRQSESGSKIPSMIQETRGELPQRFRPRDVRRVYPGWATWGSGVERRVLRVGEAAEAALFDDVVVFHFQYDQAAVDLDSGLGFE